MEPDRDESAGRSGGDGAAQDVIRDGAATQEAGGRAAVSFTPAGGSDATKRQKRQSEKSTTCATCSASLRTKG